MVNVTFLQHFMISKTNKKEARTLNVQLLFLLSKTYSRQLVVQIEEPVAKLLTYGSETQR
jgi:hypothetical protein